MNLILDQVRTPSILIDLEGGTFRHRLRQIAATLPVGEAAKRFAVIDFTDRSHTFPLNFLVPDPHYERHTVVGGFVTTLAGVWTEAFDVGARMRSIMRTAFTLLAASDLSLRYFGDIVADRKLAKVLSETSGEHEFYDLYLAHTSDALFRNWAESSLNKLTALTRSPFIGPCLDASRCFDFAAALDNGVSLLIRLDESHLAEDLNTLGALLISRIDMDASKREELADPALLVLDEVQAFATPVIERILSRRAKRGLKLIISHQFATQLEDKLVDAILMNSKTTIAFRMAHMEQARSLARQMFPLTGGREKSVEDKDRLGNKLNRVKKTYWSVNEETEHYAGELQRQGIGQAVIHEVENGDTLFLDADLAPEQNVSDAKVQEFVEASKEIHLVPLSRIAAEKQRQAEFMHRMYAEVAKLRKVERASRRTRS